VKGMMWHIGMVRVGANMMVRLEKGMMLLVLFIGNMFVIMGKLMGEVVGIIGMAYVSNIIL
jgi:hypothetical protein